MLTDVQVSCCVLHCWHDGGAGSGLGDGCSGRHLVLQSQGRSIARAMTGEAFGRLLRFQLSQSAWRLCLWLQAQVAMRLAPAHARAFL